ncbi:MAG: tRNA (adenosine(37)-N6)-threonylcarbamoyltransferase complex dimerization subunit type 1 TsaB [Gammaproteobacteria bacterium]
MKILALDTSTEACSVALCYGDKIISRYEIAPQMHTQLILPMIDELLTESSLEPSQLDALAFGRGPGAFTGVRIATGIIQGIAFAADLPVIPVSSLAAIAQGCRREQGAEKVISAIDARMGEVYWGHFHLKSEIMVACSEEAVSKPDQIFKPDGEGWFGAGSGWESYGEQLSESLASKVSENVSNAYPHAIDTLELAKDAFNKGEMISAEQAHPVYLRDNVTS